MAKHLFTACRGSLVWWCLFFYSSVVSAQSTGAVVVNTCQGGMVVLEPNNLPQHQDSRQWQVSPDGTTYTNIAGATGLSYTFTATSQDHNKYYRLLFSNSGGQQETVNNVFRISVQAPPSAPSVTNGSRTGVGPVTLGASAPAGYTYRWYVVKEGGIPVASTTSSTYTTPDLSTTTNYYVSAVSPGGCESPRATVTATVQGVSNSTIINSGLISNNQTAQPIDALQPGASQTAADVEVYRIESVPDPVQGKLYLRGAAVLKGQELLPDQVGQLTFTPEPTFYGNATFTYRTINKTGTVSEALTIYTIPVNAAPLARNVSSDLISSGTSYSLLPFPLNAVDFDGNIVQYTLTSVPTSGSLSVNISGTPELKAGDVVTTNKLYYNPNQNGKSQYERNFTYTVTDNKGVTSGTATYFLHIEITPVNSIPVAEGKVLPATSNASQTPVELPPLVATDTDGYITAYQLSGISPAGAGTLYLNGAAINSSTRQATLSGMLGGLSYVPAQGYSGNATLTFTAIDNADASSVATTYTIPVTSPPTVTDQEFAIDIDNPEAQLLDGLTASDPDGSIASFTILSVPRGYLGTLLLNGNPVATGQVLTPAEAQSLYFKKAASFDELATFRYTATDNYGVQALNPATYTLHSDRIEPLPVTLMSFTGTAGSEGATLTWATATELNNAYFIVEKSTDGKAFEEVGRVSGAGTSSVKITYTYHHAALLQSISYYRLKQVDFDGTFTYSKTIALKNRQLAASLMLQAYPNPVQENLTVKITAPATTEAILTLINLQGQQIQRSTLMLEQGVNSYELPFAKLPGGVYMLRIAADETSFTLKVLKQ